ncbi:MAG: hypothetical protein E7230_00195 [Clostridiales bacterium]|nr:hypothetical protein [Clostridiales bacterium]
MAKEYCKRIVICTIGLALFALGTVFGVLAGAAGTNGWNTLAIGTANVTGMTFGTAVLVTGAAVLLIDLLGKGKLGIGTFMNVFLISWMSDVFLKILAFVPEPPNVFVGVIYTLAGQMITAFATILYMKPALGAGPRDTLMVVIGKKFPKAPIGIVRFAIEMAALLAGVLMGAPFGIGTVLVIALQASFLQFACRVCRFEPRDVRNEDLADTFRRITKRGKAAE